MSVWTFATEVCRPVRVLRCSISWGGVAVLLALCAPPSLEGQQVEEASSELAPAAEPADPGEPEAAAEDEAAAEFEPGIAVEVAEPAEEVIMMQGGFGIGVAGDPEMKKNLAKQLVPQLEPLLRAEVHFAGIVCQLSAEQKAILQQEGAPGVQEAADAIADQQHQMQFGMRPGASHAYPNASLLITDALLKAMTKHLAAEQVQRYREELEKRAAQRRRAAILSAVAALDQELQFTTEQRKRVEQLVEKKWREEWHRDLRYYSNSLIYMPFVQSVDLRSVLTKRQNEIWNSARRNGSIMFGAEDYSQFVFLEGDDDPAAPANSAPGLEGLPAEEPVDEEAAERPEAEPTP